MKHIDCYQDTIDVINEASAFFGDTCVIDTYKLGHMKGICSLVDKLAATCDTVGVEVSVDEDAKSLSFRLISADLIVEPGPTAVFYDLIGAVDAFRFCKSGDALMTEFVICDMWRDADG